LVEQFEGFDTSKEHIVKTQITTALLTLVVCRAILRVMVDRAEKRGEDVSSPSWYRYGPQIRIASPV
jgi:hypothetical protein